MDMEITFPGGKKVNSTYKGFTIETDQARSEGGDGSAPDPYHLFLSSIGTCAGVYVVYFCHERGIDTSELKMTVRFDWNEKKSGNSQGYCHIFVAGTKRTRGNRVLYRYPGFWTLESPK